MLKPKEIKKDNSLDVNEALLNIITPSAIDFKDGFITIGETVGKCYAISRYDKNYDYGWLASLCNIPGTSTIIQYRHTDPSKLKKLYDKTIKEQRDKLNTVRNDSERQLCERIINDAKKMINSIVNGGEPIGYVNILLYPQAQTKDKLSLIVKQVNGQVQLRDCNMKPLRFREEACFETISPYGVPNIDAFTIGERNMPLRTLLGGFPMSSTGLNDKGGFFYGKTTDGRLVILNTWLRIGDRTNSNIYIQGVPGVGKSTGVKSLFTKEYAYGTKIIVYDIEQEYIETAMRPNIKGDIIDCGGGENGLINPLQIKIYPKIKKEEMSTLSEIEIEEIKADGGFVLEEIEIEEGQEKKQKLKKQKMVYSDMALHIQSLRVFFHLYKKWDYASDKMAYLEKALIEVYEAYGITWDTDVSMLNNRQFPILTNLYEKLLAEAKKKEYSKKKQEVYVSMCDDLYSCVYGADQFLWNGYTTINPKSRFIVLNTSRLQEADENVKNAQYYNITTWTWEQMSKNRNERVIAATDEGYNYMDPENIPLAKFLRNITKRSRKYEAGFVFITHSVVDILDPAVRRYGQALIDNSCYKILMGTEAKNLKDTVELLKLTDAEANVLASQQRGRCVFVAGSSRMAMNIIVNDDLLKMFGTGGGR